MNEGIELRYDKGKRLTKGKGMIGCLFESFLRGGKQEE